MGDVEKIKANLSTVNQMLGHYAPQITALIPRHLNVPRLTQLAMGAIRKNPRLGVCDPRSLVGAVIRASQLGLEIDDLRGQAYLVPFKRECTLIVGYKGYIDLAYRSPKVLHIIARPVFEGDEFEYDYGMAQPRHKPTSLSEWNPDKLTHVYVVCRLVARPEWPLWEVLTRERVEKHRARSRAKDDGPWVTDYIAMAMKTSIRVIHPFLPKSVEFQRAAALDDLAESGLSQHNESALEGEYSVEPTRTGEAPEQGPFADMVNSILSATSDERIDYLSSSIQEHEALSDEQKKELMERLGNRSKEIQKS